MSKGDKRGRKSPPQPRRRRTAGAPGRTAETLLRQQLVEARAQQDATAKILEAIARSPADVQPVFGAIVESAMRLLRGTTAHVTRLEGRRLHLVAYSKSDRAGAAALRRFYPVEVGGTLAAEALVTRKPIVVADADQDPRITDAVRATMRARRVRSFILMPLISKGATIGTIVVNRRDAGPFSKEDVRLLATFADQAVIAIENVRLFNETREALERQTATAEILRVISEYPTDVQPTFDAIVRSCQRLFAGRLVAIVIPDDGMLRRVAAAIPDGAELPVDRLPAWPLDHESAAGACVLDSRLIVVPDCEASIPEFPRMRDLALRLGYRSGLWVPLLREGTAGGCLIILRAEPGEFAEKEISLAQTFADQAAIAIGNVRLFNETREALEQQRASAQVLNVISNSVADATPVFKAIGSACQQLFGSDQVVISQVGDDGMVRHVLVEFTPHVSEQSAQMAWAALNEGFPRPLGQSYQAYPIRKRRVIHYPDMANGPGVPEGMRVITKRIGNFSMLIAPMLWEDKGIGTIHLVRVPPRPFTDKESALLKTFADQAVIAIQNARLFNQTREALERQTATAEILKVIASSPADVQPVFDAIVATVSRLFGRKAALRTVEAEGLQRRARSYDPAPDEYHGREVEALDRRSIVGQAVLEGRALQWRDTLVDGAAVYGLEHARTLSFRSIASAPLMRDARAIGVISVSSPEPGELTRNQMELLATFADQAVIAIENVRLFNETKEALERQTATAEILKVIASSPTDLQPVLDAIAENAARVCGAEDVIIWRAYGSTVCVAAKHGPFPSEQIGHERVLVRGRVSDRAVIDRETIHVHDLAASEAEFPEARTGGLKWGVRTTLATPLMREGVAIGTIHCRRMEVRPFTDKQIDLLKAFADQAVIAIENVRLFNETKEALERQTATAEILKVISSSPTDVQPVLEAVATSAARLCEAKDVVVMLKEDDALRYRVHHGDIAPGAPLGETKAISRDWSAGRCAAEGRQIHIHDILEAPDDFPDGSRMGMNAGYRTVLMTPLLRDGVVLGVIGMRRAEVRPFEPRQIELINTFADQAVIAIENVRLFKELQARTEALSKSVSQLTALSEVGQAISATLDLEQVLKTIVSRAVQLSGLDAGVIYEYDPQKDQFLLRASELFDESQVDEFRGATIRRGEGAVGTSVETREPVQVPDTHVTSYPAHLRGLLDRAGFRALLAVPLLREEQIVGALMVIRRLPGEFPAETVEVLKTFASQSALAIQNARLYREIAEKSRQLEEASRHKSNFLASMSHELRTPLNAILGFNEMILGQVYGEVPADMQEPLGDIQKSGKHLLRLINNVLDLAKIEAGRMELALSDYSVQDTVASVHATLRPLAAEKGLEFLASVPGDLPLAHGDGGRIAQCLMNLAGNSLKFTKTGRVEISAAEAGGRLTYRVADTGIGIAADKVGSLFTEFKQTDATIASEYGGTGLGLAITRQFIEMHGGRIWVESEPGRGSTFLFEVPLRAGAA